MEKPDWVLWGDGRKFVTLEECVCLSLDADPLQPQKPSKRKEFSGNPDPQGQPWAAPVVIWSGDHLTKQQRNEWLELNHEALLSQKGVERLAELRRHFDGGQRLLLPSGPYEREQKRVLLYDFAKWAQAMQWDVPEQLRITPAPATDTVASAPVVAASDTKPWLCIDPKDPQPEQQWYIPARYFARQFVIDDSALLTKRERLAAKVSKSLAETGFLRRGGKVELSPSTVLKAFVNVKLG